jgi:hypothetical protein
VEDCVSIDANRWTRAGIQKADVHTAGSRLLTDRSGSVFTVNYEVDTLNLACPSVRLWYSWVWTATRQHGLADYRVSLSATQPRFGGLRWWFLCPLIVKGRPCNRRVGKLYLPPRAHYFGCRHCHELTYRSCQESRKYDSLYRLIAREMGEETTTVKRLMRRFWED